ncbi:MAG: tetratricopeptide repeat protein [Kiritimatiellae bacterium]|nr:tetratricopeptide repeat protein [Kiritimatiellia bacterium]
MANDALAQKAQNFTNRGRQALEAGRYELAVEMLSQAIDCAPSSLETRRLLRAAQIAKFRQNPPSSFALKLQGLSNMGKRSKIMSLVKKGQGAEAMAEAEKLLEINPMDPDNIECAVKAAEAAGMPEAAAISVEAAYSCSRGDANLLERVAQYYMVAKRYDKARDAYVKLSQLKPGDQRIIQLLKNAEAQSTMSSGWSDTVGKKGGYQAILANQEQAKKINQANKAVVTGDDADAMIAEKLAQIEKEPNNLNFYRALARIYMQNKRFEEAVGILQRAQTVSQADPELDRMLSTVTTANYEYNVEQLRKEGRNEEADNLEAEKNQFVFDDLATRVERYPNDLHLRFELGYQYYIYGDADPSFYDEAVQHLQLAQKSPKDRLQALYYLAMCFLKKGQNDMAVMQLETARDQIPTMDDLKKKVVYQLGLCAEEGGDLEKAYNYYKDVYTHDVTFGDLSERMLRVNKQLHEQQKV